MAIAMAVAMGRLKRAARPWAWGCVLALASLSAHAQRTEGDPVQAEGLYAAEVPVNGQGERERRVGFSRALSEVLTRLTGESRIAARTGVGAELRKAGDYVEGYDYRQDKGVGPSGAPSFKTILVVRFKQEAVDDMISVLGLQLWPQPRPKPVLWLAIDDGSGPRLVGVSRAEAARPTLEQAEERGFALGLPAGHASEQALVGAIWRGDGAAIARASKRYSPPMQLIGKLYRKDGGWAADWTFQDAGRVLAQSSESGSNVRTVLASGADVAVAALVKRYAKPAEAAGPSGTYRIAFVGIDSADDYVRLSGYLQRLSVVRGMTPVRATPERVEYELELISGIPGFKRLVERESVLSDASDGSTVYRLRP
ncbi:MAG: DUF2066 domain-containing protein [Pseudomonadota bacterium]|nr:DUF2066 domain-containing protein [Pseudomonadota bacterium]